MKSGTKWQALKKKKAVKLKKVNTGLTGKEIESIISKCAKSNVREVNVAGIRLKFGEEVPAKLPVTGSKASKTTKPADAAMSDKQHQKLNKEALAEMEAEIKEERLSLMMIEDAPQYERLVTSGELFDGGQNGDEEALD